MILLPGIVLQYVNLILSLEKKYKVKIVAEDYFKLKSIKNCKIFGKIISDESFIHYRFFRIA